MSQLLLFGQVASSSGWISYDELGKKEDLETNVGKGGVNPKVSIPSPFARFELQQTAFRNVKQLGSASQPRDKRLVFYTLDVAQLFFENPDGLEISVWTINDQLRQLEQSSMTGHKQMAKVLRLYMQHENYGFNSNANPNIYMISYRGKLVGCTSPTSLFMPTPNFKEVMGLNVELQGGLKLFNNQEQLHDKRRSPEFVIYLYRTLGAVRRAFERNHGIKRSEDFPLNDLWEYCSNEEQYLDSELKQAIQGWKNSEFSFESYEMSKDGVSLFGCNLYQQVKEDAYLQIARKSSFTIDSRKSDKKPLVLTNTNGGYDGWSYTAEGKRWKYCIKNSDIEKKRKGNNELLPNDAEIKYEYGWLCEEDFLDEKLIRLPYPLDKERFFDGNLKPAKIHASQKKENLEYYYFYLLPIKRKFFEFFDYDYLKETTGRTPNFNIEELANGDVRVNLWVPVQGGKIRLTKLYKDGGELESMRALGKPDSSYEAEGAVCECPVALGMMPFVKMPEDKDNHYSIQLMTNTDLGDFDLKLQAYKKNETKDYAVTAQSYKRSAMTRYYTIDNDSFDYFIISFEKTKTGNVMRAHEAVLIPNIPKANPGNAGFNFAFDFGTSNSYIAVKKGDETLDIDLDGGICGTVDTRMTEHYKEGELLCIKGLRITQEQEFIPNDFGKKYSFPHRTVLSYAKTLDKDELSALREANIPFIYGKGDYGINANEIATGFKWNDGDLRFANAFIDELARIAYAYAVKNDANLQNCSFIWTYPLSMLNGQLIDNFERQWKKSYLKYFVNSNSSIDDEEDIVKDKVQRMTESIAPFLKYSSATNNIADMTLSIDIGGGTSDVVIYKNAENIKLASVRYAADVIFGGGGSKAESNRMIAKYYNVFAGKLRENRDVKKLLDNFCSPASQYKPSEASSILFSLEDNPYLESGNMSYNKELAKDAEFKIIFIYFYAAILYYLTDLLLANGYPAPERLLYSGTGSKMLNIIGNNRILSDVTTQMIQTFSNEKYHYDEDIAISMEKKQPKQVTAQGALSWDANENCKTVAGIFKDDKKREIKNRIVHHTMIPSEDEEEPCRKLRNKDIFDEKVIGTIVGKVEDFHKKLSDLCTKDFLEDFGCNEMARVFIEKVAKMNNHKIQNALENVFWSRNNRKKLAAKSDDELSESALFFCPITDIIDKYLLKNQE